MTLRQETRWDYSMDPEQEKGQSLYKMYQIINTESNRAMKSDVRAC